LFLESSVDDYKIEDVKEYFDDLYYVDGYEDISASLWDALLFAMATVLANKLFDRPTWIVFTAHASAGKTVAIDTLFGLRHSVDIYPLSSGTLNSFVSGGPRTDGENDLADEIMPRCTLLMTDLATFLGDTKDIVRKRMGELTSIYDGKLIKITPMGGTRVFPEHIGLIGATTPGTAEMNAGELNKIGNRLLFYQFPLVDDKYAFELLKKNDMVFDEKLSRLRNAVKIFLIPMFLDEKKLSQSFESCDKRTREALECSSQYLKFIRGDGAVFRAYEQLQSILRAYEYIKTGSKKISYDTAKNKTMPFLPDETADKSHFIIRVLLSSNDESMSINQIHKEVMSMISIKEGKDVSWTRRRCKKLEETGILKKDMIRFGRNFRFEYSISNEYREIFEEKYGLNDVKDMDSEVRLW